MKKLEITPAPGVAQTHTRSKSSGKNQDVATETAATADPSAESDFAQVRVFGPDGGLFRVHTQIGTLANLMANAPDTQIKAEELLEYLWTWQDMLLPAMRKAGVEPVKFGY